MSVHTGLYGDKSLSCKDKVLRTMYMINVNIREHIDR